MSAAGEEAGRNDKTMQRDSLVSVYVMFFGFECVCVGAYILWEWRQHNQGAMC